MTRVTRKTIRSVAIPAEHGSWSFWLEPVLLAFLLAPSGTGIALIILSLASFLMRQPLKIAWMDLRKKKLYARTRVGVGFVGLYGLIALLAFLASLAGGGFIVIAPLIPAYIIAILQVWQFDIRGNSRHWLPEALGATVMSTFAISIALAGGRTLETALMLSLIIIARAIPTIFYVRARLRQIKSNQTKPQVALLLHAVAVVITFGFALIGYMPYLTVLALLILAGRAFYFLHRSAVIPAKILGIQEVIFGLILVSLTVLGFTLNI